MTSSWASSIATEAEQFPGRTARALRAVRAGRCIPTKRGSSSSVAMRDRIGERVATGKPETFNFLGFTHSCGEDPEGAASRCCGRRCGSGGRRSCRRLKPNCGDACTTPLPEQGAYLRSVVLGHLRYYGVPMQRSPRCARSARQSGWLWWRCLRRRSQSDRCRGTAWSALSRVASARAYLSSVPAHAPWRYHPRWEPDAVMPHVRICGGGHERSWSLRRLFFPTGIAVELTEQSIPIFFGPVGQVRDEVLDLVAGGIPKGPNPTEIGRV